MYTCPYCGTTYPEFISNCTNCGGPLDSPEVSRRYFDEAVPIEPPPPPRPISDSFAWKLVWTDGWGVASAVFIMIGVIFAIVGLILTAVIITAFVGLPLFLVGLVLLGVGVPVFMERLNRSRKTVQVLREGESTIGAITRVEQNLMVRVNHQNPWLITYSYRLFGKDYEGKVSTLNTPGAHLAEGRPASVLYLPGSPEASSLYPHP